MIKFHLYTQKKLLILGALYCVREGLQIVSHIEKCLDANDDSLKATKAAKRVWSEVEVYRTWLQINLQKMACKGKQSKEILKWLGDEAATIVIQYMSSKKQCVHRSPDEFILASSMYRITQTILSHFNEHECWFNDEEIFEWISTMIADILLACFTNLPHVIKIMCHHHAIEKRGDSIYSAAQLLGKSKKILKILKARQLPNIDLDSMAYNIDNWRALPEGQITNGDHIPNDDAFSSGFH
ncbi:uncharacterized protein LOC143581725 [Bidens hawaiensis]|uniref:uncharacterized protein LOC143581725 n=1 Tax=Bidens hawaiensis TaxID=980011 RepID=UPI00404A3EEB